MRLAKMYKLFSSLTDILCPISKGLNHSKNQRKAQTLVYKQLLVGIPCEINLQNYLYLMGIFIYTRC